MKKTIIGLILALPILIGFDGATALRLTALWRGRNHDSNRIERRDGAPKRQFRVNEVFYEYL
ncbi:MAG TPA: hypothetical protein PLV42_06910 [bacterium]|nr:hypothetical protein [bacterium]